MGFRLEIIPAGAAESDCAPHAAIAEVLGALDGSPVGHYIEECRDSTRGALLAVDDPECGLLAALLMLAKDHDLAVYDIELKRLYDPVGAVDVDVLLPGVRIPFLTRELLVDLVLHPGWPAPEAPYLIVERAEQDFIQAWLGDHGLYQLEYREGGPESHFVVHTDDPELVVCTMWAWATRDESWRTAVDWQFVDLEEEDEGEAAQELQSRFVRLQDVHLEDGSWLNLDARLGTDGALDITGQDLGPVTRMMSDDGEYEWGYSVAPENVPTLVVALGGLPGEDIIDVLERCWSGRNVGGLESAIRASGVPYAFWSYP